MTATDDNPRISDTSNKKGTIHCITLTLPLSWKLLIKFYKFTLSTRQPSPSTAQRSRPAQCTCADSLHSPSQSEPIGETHTRTFLTLGHSFVKQSVQVNKLLLKKCVAGRAGHCRCEVVSHGSCHWMYYDCSGALHDTSSNPYRKVKLTTESSNNRKFCQEKDTWCVTVTTETTGTRKGNKYYDNTTKYILKALKWWRWIVKRTE